MAASTTAGAVAARLGAASALVHPITATPLFLRFSTTQAPAIPPPAAPAQRLPPATSGPQRTASDRGAWLDKVALTTRKRRARKKRKIRPNPRAGGPRRAKSWFCPIAPIARPQARGTRGGDWPGQT